MIRGSRPRRPTSRRGFTLVELMVAALMTAFVMSAVTMCLAQLSRAKSGARQQLMAHLRADAALNLVRRDIVTVLRDQDLFWTRLLLSDHAVSTPAGTMDRDELVVFNTQMRPIRDLDFIGDGAEFESQLRIEEDTDGVVLWQRRDAAPDEYPLGGGVATPIVDGVLSLGMEAYDGELWYQSWDSDFDGLPLAVRVTVVASGCRDGRDPYAATMAILRTVIPIDRVPPPVEPPAEPDEQGADLDGDGVPDDPAGGAQPGTPDGGAAPPEDLLPPGGSPGSGGGGTGSGAGGSRTGEIGARRGNVPVTRSQEGPR
jgi:prepilin-type N-terminal cleavage/methylation domain-containing protein